MDASVGRHRLWGAAMAAASLFAIALATGPTAARAADPPSPGPAPGSGGDQVVLLGRVIVPRGQSVGEVVVFSGRVAVAGVVRGDVVVLDGPIVISGQVSGSVIALGGSIRLLAGAQVGGDVLAHEHAIVADGVAVAGAIRESVPFTIRGPLHALGAFLSWLSVAISTLLLGMAFAGIAPRAMDGVALAGRTAPFASAGWGVGVLVGLPLLAIGTVALIVGLPFGLALLLASLLLALLGAVATAHTVGRWLLHEERGTATAFLAGWGVAAIVGVVPFVSGVIFALSSVFGLGEITVALWRARRVSRGGRHRLGATLPASALGDQTAPGVSPLPSD